VDARASGREPLLIATAGEDFAEYRVALDRADVDTSGVTVIPGEFTASCFINTDLDANQIVAFYAGALSHGHKLELGGRGLGPEDLVVISPTDPDSMLKAVEACRAAAGALPVRPGEADATARGAADPRTGWSRRPAVIGNDYEFALMSQKTGKSEAVLQCIAPVTIVTRGEQGSTVPERGKPLGGLPVAPISMLSTRPRAMRPGGPGPRDGPEAPLGRGSPSDRRGGGCVRDRGPGPARAPVQAREFVARYRAAFRERGR
jgi:adenosine kinase